MTEKRPFRFGVGISTAESPAIWRDKARTAEALGYDILLIPDHLGDQLAIGPALAVAAEATTTLRIGTLVIQNDLRHPALLAKEAATLDLLSNGRFELGLGAGGSWMPDYEATDIPFAPPGQRVARLDECVRVIGDLWADAPVTFSGDHYTFTTFNGMPKPVQRPRPPILVGAGGRRALSIAARRADIVGILPRLLPAGGQFQMDDLTAEAFGRQIDWIRQEAGDRFAGLEINVLVQRLIVTDDARAASRDLSQEWEVLTPDQVLDTPCLLIGSIDGIVATLRERRERLGLSYLIVFERDMEAFAPVVARLAST